jgi:hypothetical protein
MKEYFEAIWDLISTTLFGERTMGGQPINLVKGRKVDFKTTYPDNQPDENTWMQMFRVSSLHNVNQRVFIER